MATESSTRVIIRFGGQTLAGALSAHSHYLVTTTTTVLSIRPTTWCGGSQLAPAPIWPLMETAMESLTLEITPRGVANSAKLPAPRPLRQLDWGHKFSTALVCQ